MSGVLKFEKLFINDFMSRLFLLDGCLSTFSSIANEAGHVIYELGAGIVCFGTMMMEIRQKNIIKVLKRVWSLRISYFSTQVKFESLTGKSLFITKTRTNERISFM